ncbi:hypothetical protein IAT38_005689 [Cryptococcus sp. DSM 104549]
MPDQVASRASWLARRQTSGVYPDETWDDWDGTTEHSQEGESSILSLGSGDHLHRQDVGEPHIPPRTLPYRQPSDLPDEPRDKNEAKDGRPAPRCYPFFSDNGTVVSAARSIFKAAPSLASDTSYLDAPITPLQHPSLTPTRSTRRTTASFYSPGSHNSPHSTRSPRRHAQPLRSIYSCLSSLPRDKLNTIDLWRHRVALEDHLPGSAEWVAVLMEVGKIELRMGRGSRGRLFGGWDGGAWESGNGGGDGGKDGASKASGALGLRPVDTRWSGIFGFRWGRGKGGSYQASLGDKRAIIVPSLPSPTSPEWDKGGKKESEVLPLGAGDGESPRRSGEACDGGMKGGGWWGKVKGRWGGRRGRKDAEQSAVVEET